MAQTSISKLLVLTVAATSLILSPAVTQAARGGAPRIEDIEQSLTADRSYKVRVEAALILGRLKERRSVAALITALRDSHPAVRATAAQALGRIGDQSARDPLLRAHQDGNRFVRRMSGEAIRALQAKARNPDPQVATTRGPTGRPAFDVKPMGDRSHKATPALRGRMRDFVTTHLRSVGDITVSNEEPGFVVDGSIKELSMTTGPDLVQVGCSVQLVVSRHPSGGVFLLTSGEAMVQKPANQFKPQQKATMEMEALEHAVRGASEDLLQSLRRQ
ncbi:MAG TPA: HEAT repeat domain-containing protein [Polyangia bacterium]|nr:HEAT repeat domain-containing protein [Polyangia bacterium]